MCRILEQPSLALQLIVSGTHLSERFGLTYRQIEEDGFRIDEKIEMPIVSDTPEYITTAVGNVTTQIGAAINRLNPDAVIVLGDRYELLAVATAATIARVPLLHIGGGEVTEGAMDDSVRHAITKMSWLHFAATEGYRQRIIQLGESPTRVFTVGAIGLDNIECMKFLNRDELSTRLKFDLSGDYVLATYHPETLGTGDSAAGVTALIEALRVRPRLKVIFTGVNADPGHSRIEERVGEFTMAYPARVYFSYSLGQLKYLSAMKYCAAVVGNSSSGIVEAPSMGVPTVNIGDRQRGRERAASVIDCSENIQTIANALDMALSEGFRLFARGVKSPYGNGGVSKRIVDIIVGSQLSRSMPKPFWNIKV